MPMLILLVGLLLLGLMTAMPRLRARPVPARVRTVPPAFARAPARDAANPKE